MNLLFSSDARPRYKTDILDALCYPVGHRLRFRYQDHHVSPIVKGWRQKPSGQVIVPSGTDAALIVFADTTRAAESKTFEFFPVRRGHIRNLWKPGTIYN